MTFLVFFLLGYSSATTTNYLFPGRIFKLWLSLEFVIAQNFHGQSRFLAAIYSIQHRFTSFYPLMLTLQKCFPSSLLKLYNNHLLLFQVLCPPLYTTVLCPLCTSNLYFSVTITFLSTNFITYFLTCFQNFLPNTSSLLFLLNMFWQNAYLKYS